MTPAAKKLFSQIKTRNAKIAVVGLGYVGLPLALAFVKKGFRVAGIDLDRNRIDRIRQGESYVEDVPCGEVQQAIRRGRFEVSDHYGVLDEVEALIVCVPTPLNRAKDPDLSFILSATEQVKQHLHSGQLVILESTTYPGTTEEVVLPSLESTGLRAGQDFFLCFSPERIDPGNKKFPLSKIPKVVGGITPLCTQLGAALYHHVTDRVVSVSSARTAEMAKLLENTFRIVNIGLINELAQVAQALGVDIWEVIEAASSKPFGFMPFYPGPGIGGHCIGVDPIYLSWKARVQGVDIHFIELARRINAEMPRFVVTKAVYLLNDRLRKAVSRSRILVLGISYKADVGDTRESPALEILHELRRLGARVSYHDPLVPEFKNEHFELKSEPLNARNLRSKDMVIIATAHSVVNYSLIARQAKLIFDTRNVNFPNRFSSKVARL